MEEDVKKTDGISDDAPMARINVTFDVDGQVKQQMFIHQVLDGDFYVLMHGDENVNTKDREIFEMVRKAFIKGIQSEILGFLIREEKK